MPSAAEPSHNGPAAIWLLADLSLNIWALSIVKALGLSYPAFQLVFLRAAVGLLLMAPWIWHQRAAFVAVQDLRLHGLRVAFSAIALTASFYAIARLPFALFTAISFTRPILIMIAAAWLLREAVTRDRWIAAALCFVGVLIAVNPDAMVANTGLAAQFLVVLAATGAVISTRRLRAAPTVVMMTFYAAGLSAISAVPAFVTWQPVAADHWPALLSIGLFAQTAQFCFLRAHHFGQASFLAILSYASLVFSTVAGYVFFAEVPQPAFWLGAAFIIGAALWVTLVRPKGQN